MSLALGRRQFCVLGGVTSDLPAKQQMIASEMG